MPARPAALPCLRDPCRPALPLPAGTPVGIELRAEGFCAGVAADCVGYGHDYPGRGGGDDLAEFARPAALVAGFAHVDLGGPKNCGGWGKMREL